MTKRIFYLKTCSTCSRILKELEPGAEFELREIKSNPISTGELDALAKGAGSYESLFSRKSQKFRLMGLHEKTLSETDYRNLILMEYTFLKRPVFQINNEVFAGNSKETIEKVKKQLQKDEQA